MRKTVLEQSREFIKENSKNNNFIFSSSEIKITIRNFLTKNNYLYSPIKNIFILKKSDDNISEKLNEYKFGIIEKLGGVLSGEFLINYYLGKIKFARIFRIITKSKNFESYLGEDKNIENIKIIFKPSNIPRITKKIVIQENKNNSKKYSFIIEDKLSFIINNYYLLWENKDFQKIILDTDFTIKEIENLIDKKFKFSAISKIAIFYKNNNEIGKYEMIIKASRNKGKTLDRRGIKVIKKIEKKNESKKVNLNDLF